MISRKIYLTTNYDIFQMHGEVLTKWTFMPYNSYNFVGIWLITKDNFDSNCIVNFVPTDKVTGLSMVDWFQFASTVLGKESDATLCWNLLEHTARDIKFLTTILAKSWLMFHIIYQVDDILSMNSILLTKFSAGAAMGDYGWKKCSRQISVVSFQNNETSIGAAMRNFS